MKQDDRYLTKVERWYNKLDMNIVNEALSKISDLKAIIIKVIEY